jgi:hypothetical protein
VAHGLPAALVFLNADLTNGGSLYSQHGHPLRRDSEGGSGTHGPQDRSDLRPLRHHFSATSRKALSILPACWMFPKLNRELNKWRSSADGVDRLADFLVNYGCGGVQPAEFGVLLVRRVATAEGHSHRIPASQLQIHRVLWKVSARLQLLNAWEVTTARLVRQSAAASRELSNGRVLSATLDRSSGTPASPSHAIETAYRLSVSR